MPKSVELKTVLTLRNQSDWLISSAAQWGVSDVAFVERLIRDDDAFLDYDAITKDLESLLGRGNHLTLLFENGLEHNIQKILEFATYPPVEIPKLQMSQSRENVRKTDEGWSVRETKPTERFERRLLAIRRSLPLINKHLTSNQALRRTLRPFLGYNARTRTLSSIPALAKSINVALTEEQRAAIKSHCQASNTRLSAHLDVDLEALGY